MGRQDVSHDASDATPRRRRTPVPATRDSVLKRRNEAPLRPITGRAREREKLFSSPDMDRFSACE